MVSLTGDGADELFLGYSLSRLDILLEMRSRGGAYPVKVEPLMEEFSKETKGALGIMPKDTPR